MSDKAGVLEGSGLDFGGPGPRFWRLSAPKSSHCQPENISIKGGGLIEMFFIVASVPKGNPQTFLPTKGEAAVVPLGGFQSAAH